MGFLQLWEVMVTLLRYLGAPKHLRLTSFALRKLVPENMKCPRTWMTKVPRMKQVWNSPGRTGWFFVHIYINCLSLLQLPINFFIRISMSLSSEQAVSSHCYTLRGSSPALRCRSAWLHSPSHPRDPRGPRDQGASWQPVVTSWHHRPGKKGNLFVAP